MPVYICRASSGFSGVYEDIEVEADSEEEAKDLAYEAWMELLNPYIESVEEAE